MRVISGRARGRKLQAPVGLNTRPTTDRVKESIFSMINFYIRESRVLDLFAGTGALGIEAISRGAQYGVFVDNNKKSVDVINKNLRDVKFEKESLVLNCDINTALSKLATKTEKFDVIFMDPPYLKGFIIPTIEKIDNSQLLNDGGIILIEHDQKDVLEEKIGNFYRSKFKKYGNTLISIYKKEE